MLPESRFPTHPSEVLQEELLAPIGLTQADLATHLGVPVQRINEVVHGDMRITSKMAQLLSQAFGTTPAFWITLQANYDAMINRSKNRR